MNISIASGKGGTGKTTVAVNLAHVWAEKSATPVHLVDCDVEAPNDHLFLNFEEFLSTPVNLPKPVIDEDKCTGCGKCARACNYNALTVIKKKVLLFDELCHSCNVCNYVCPQQAVSSAPVKIGNIHNVEQGLPFKLSWGELDIGQVQAPDIIRELRNSLDKDSINILDSSPGCGCAVRETLAGVDVVLLVTEPTPFGLNDLRLAAELSLQLRIPTGIIINRSDGKDKIIEDFSQTSRIPILGRIPFERKYAESYSKGKLLAEDYPEVRTIMQDLCEKIMDLAETFPPRQTFNFADISELNKPDESPAPQRSDISEAVVISGKGGTGKTTVCASLASLREQSIFFDADVDASNLPILLKGRIKSTQKFSSGAKAEIKNEICVKCGKCAEFCRFKAIEKLGNAGFKVIEEACEGCGLCEFVCPVNAAQMHPADTGYCHLSETAYGELSHAFLNIGEENSGKLVTEVRNQALRIASRKNNLNILGDGSPGVACPVIAAITGCNLAVAVTEPTVSGIHDLKRVIKLARYFDIDSCVVINKADINPEQTEKIKVFCAENTIPVIGEIPFDEAVGKALKESKHLMEIPPCPAQNAIEKISNELKAKFNI
jgi:MinD superfamily P-loop ATPase